MGIMQVGKSWMSKAYNYGFKKTFVALSEMPIMDKGYASYRSNNRKVIDGIGIASIILKDGVGCYMYVNQSLHNDKIPEDKRRFVAALDLANGGLMILAQILMHVTISNKIVQTKMFEKFFGKNFDRNAQKMIQAVLRNTEKYKNTSPHEIAESFAKIKGSVCDAFGSLTSLFAATTIGKRVIVPFIATPLAGKVEERMNKNKKQSVIDKETQNNYNPSKHAINKRAKTDSVNLTANIATDKKNTEASSANTNLLGNFKNINATLANTGKKTLNAVTGTLNNKSESVEN